jgi:hypothetical protein
LILEKRPVACCDRAFFLWIPVGAQRLRPRPSIKIDQSPINIVVNRSQSIRLLNIVSDRVESGWAQALRPYGN